VRAVEVYRGTPTLPRGLVSSERGTSISWVDDGKTAALSVYGSSTCPPRLATIEVASAVEVHLRLTDDSTACTDDLVATTTEFPIPAMVSRTESVHVALQIGNDADAAELRPIRATSPADTDPAS
jgi:hypothetical protein